MILKQKHPALRRMLLLLLCLALLLPQASLAAGSKKASDGEIRVLLTRLSLKTEAWMTLEGRYLARGANGTEVLLPAGAQITVFLRNGQLALFHDGLSLNAGPELQLLRRQDGDIEPGIRFNLYAGVYPGDLTLSVQDGAIRPVLKLPLEKYLLGVVPYEMSDSFPLEALKVQAVCARTYALSKMNGSGDYDVVDNTNDQVFRGTPDKCENTARAVEETAGLVLTFNNNLITAWYSASNGGQTELPGNVWKGDNIPGCFAMVDDPWDAQNPDSTVRTAVLGRDGSGLSKGMLRLIRTALSREPELDDYRLTDDPAVPDKFALPAVTVKSGEYFLLYCSGDETLSEGSAVHGPFRLNGGEDRVYLYSAQGELLDYLHVYKVPPQGSIGRSGREGKLTLYDAPTPNKENKGGTELMQFSAVPTADVGSGVYETGESLYVTLSAPGTIHYTTDGSRPTADSPAYTQPLEISKTSVLRAAALEEDKCLSDVLTLAYTVNEGHSLPVLNLIMAPGDFSGSKGIYSHPKELWQKDACLVYTDEKGTVTHDCGIRISGQHSRTRPQKSFKLIFSDQYGGRLRYDIFGDTCEQKSFPQLLVRAGIDSKYGVYREPLIQKMAMPYRDTTFVQDSVPCVVYINGEYYGIYQFMEALSEETLADRLGVRTDSITLFKGYMYPGHKDLEIYQLMEYVADHDMADSACYEYAKEHLALEDLIDWAIFQAYCHNADISGNVRYFKSSETDGRWHFVFYDVECGFKVAADFNDVLNNGQTSIFLNALLKNSEFRDMFLRRLEYHCEHTFTREQVLSLLHWYDDAVRKETERHFIRWKLQPITYIYNYNLFERLLTADRAGELKLSAKKFLALSDEEYNAYFRG